MRTRPFESNRQSSRAPAIPTLSRTLSRAATGPAPEEGAEMRFVVGECSLGSILVAKSGKGICAILLGDDPDTLISELQRRFPNVQPAGGDSEFMRLVAKVARFVEDPSKDLDLPLDLHGTPFQQKVWRELRKIPPGTITSYGQIAKRIGTPKSVRAVAGAIAANPIAVAVPCHRVVRTGGALGGYRWGSERKRALLEREKVKGTKGRGRNERKGEGEMNVPRLRNRN